MAIPIGTTARHLESIARWVLAAVVVVGMLSWWLPGYRIWGAMSAGLLTVWVLWLLWRTVLDDRTVPDHPVHLALIVPAMILTYHAAAAGLGPARQDAAPLEGSLNMSMLFHLWLLAVGVLVAQSLLARAARHSAVLCLCGAAMMGGAVLAVMFGRMEHVRDAMGFVGFAGVGVWLTSLWGAASDDGRPHPLKGLKLRLACLGVAAAMSAILAWMAPLAAAVSLVVVAVVLILSGLIFPGARAAMLTIGCLLGAPAGWALMRWGAPGSLGKVAASWVGRGESGFSAVSAADSGLAVLAASIGYLGVAWLIGGMMLAGGYLLFRSPRCRRDERRRAIVWTVATALASCAMLGRGGWFIPSVTLAVAFTWGLLPVMLGRRQRPRSGVFLLIAMVVMMLLLGLARQEGLAGQIAYDMGGDDAVAHGCAGLILALLLGWLMGSRRWYLGVGGILLSVLAGGAGELLQWMFSERSVEFADWLAHVVGCAAALPLYLLCLGSRWCESPDAIARARRA